MQNKEPAPQDKNPRPKTLTAPFAVMRHTDSRGWLVRDAAGVSVFPIVRYENEEAAANEIAEAMNAYSKLGKIMKANKALTEALTAMLEVQGRRRHPLGQPDEGIAIMAAEAVSKARAAILTSEAARG